MYYYYDLTTFEFLISSSKKLGEYSNYTEITPLEYDNSIKKLFFNTQKQIWEVKDIITNGYYVKIDFQDFTKIVKIFQNPTMEEVVVNNYFFLFTATQIINDAIKQYYNQLRFFKVSKNNVFVDFACKPDDVIINYNKIWGFTTVNNNILSSEQNGKESYTYYVDKTNYIDVSLVHLKELTKQMNSFHINTGTLMRLHQSFIANAIVNNSIEDILNYDYRLEIRENVLNGEKPYIVNPFPNQNI